jgi:putative glycosyl hydrolase/Big-like domain-containing protein
MMGPPRARSDADRLRARMGMARRQRGGSLATRVALVLGVVALSLFGASTAQAARSEFYGIVQGVLDEQDRVGMEAAKVRAARFVLRWRSIEPTKGNYDWSERDRFIGALASHGIRGLPFLWGSPTWVGNGALAQPPIFSAEDRQAWRDFVTRAVARYGPGGSYWGAPYHNEFGASAVAYPITAWQVWNEPNLKKFFSPGANVQQSAARYATVLDIAAGAIRARAPTAKVLLAGMPGVGDSTAGTFLNNIYKVSGSKGDFDAASLHPYSCSVDGVRDEMMSFRQVMEANLDKGTPLWVTEFAWGSGPPDQFCKNRGLDGQADLLRRSFDLFLLRRRDWNLQAVYWFLWRDPEAGSPYASLCSICGTAGLLRNNRTKKPAYFIFDNYTLDTTVPQVNIVQGPNQGAFINDPTPTFKMASNEDSPSPPTSPGGTVFVCHYDTAPFISCPTTYTRTSSLTNGAHTFYARAVDAAGNESQIKTRSFTVDTIPPQTTITGGPSGPTADHTPTFTFSSSQANSTFQCRFDAQPFAACSGPGASHTPTTPLSTGNHTFAVRARDRAGNLDASPATRAFSVL